MKLIKSKISKSLGPHLSAAGFIGGIISLIIGFITKVDVAFASGLFSFILGGLVLCGYSASTFKTFTYEVIHYKDVDVDNCHIVLIENGKFYIVSTFFTKQAYDKIKGGEPIILICKFNYFSSTDSYPDSSVVTIGLEESIATIVKRNSKL